MIPIGDVVAKCGEYEALEFIARNMSPERAAEGRATHERMKWKPRYVARSRQITPSQGILSNTITCA